MQCLGICPGNWAWGRRWKPNLTLRFWKQQLRQKTQDFISLLRIQHAYNCLPKADLPCD